MIMPPILLAMTLLSSPDQVMRAQEALAAHPKMSEEEMAAGVEKPREASGALRIRAARSDLDRLNGVAMFEKDVQVNYADDATLAADRLYVFFSGTNELTRIVAVGNVSITNETRVGTCATIVYYRKTGEFEMHADRDGTLARLVDYGENASEVEGTRIRFRLDTEQVSVEDSRVRVRKAEGKKVL